MLPNGTYLLTVRRRPMAAASRRIDTSVVVDGNLKLGRYQSTYQDLDVGVGGLPIQVLRSYDSFDKASGDFGVGWNVSPGQLPDQGQPAVRSRGLDPDAGQLLDHRLHPALPVVGAAFRDRRLAGRPPGDLRLPPATAARSSRS